MGTSTMLAVCHGCGKEIIPGNRPDGTPNGVGFVMANGSVINFCADCIIALGMKQEGK